MLDRSLITEGGHFAPAALKGPGSTNVALLSLSDVSTLLT
jgi:hypothetical protein